MSISGEPTTGRPDLPSRPMPLTYTMELPLNEISRAPNSPIQAPPSPPPLLTIYLPSSETEPAESRSASPYARSIRSIKSRYLEDIRHEVMVNYLFQQQCAYLWLDHENPSDCEGVILRKAKGRYLTCPPQLVESTLATACIELNLQVRLPTLTKFLF
jgi:hypothetical protein